MKFGDVPERNLQASNNDESPNSDGDEQQTKRRSTREKRQPSYFKDYEVHLNNCSITLGFEEGKGHPEWEAAMQEDIDALNRNHTWEMVSKPENC